MNKAIRIACAFTLWLAGMGLALAQTNSIEAEALQDQRDARSAESAGQVRPTERCLGVRRPNLSGVHTGGRTQNRIRVTSEAYHRPLRLVRAAPIPLAADHA